MSLLRRIVGLGERLRNDELRQVDLILQEVGDDLLRIVLRALDVALDEHFPQAGVDDRNDEAAVVATDGLRGSQAVRRPR